MSMPEKSPSKISVQIKDDNYYTQLNKEEISELQKIHEEVSDDVEEMRSSLKKYQRQRHWLLWHDHSTLANYGHMLFCVWELYDPAIHFKWQEMIDKTGKDRHTGHYWGNTALYSGTE